MDLQFFASNDPYEDNLYCDFDASATKAISGADIVLAIFDLTGEDLLAVSGQQNLTINRSSDEIEVSSKDTKGGWKSKIAGMKEWSVDNDGFYVPNDQTHQILSRKFEDGDLVCLKVLNQKEGYGMFGGLASITDYPLEAPYDDAMTYSLTLSGNGALVDLQYEPTPNDKMPSNIQTGQGL